MHVLYIGFVGYAGNLCLLCWHYAQCFCTTYYAHSYAGIIGSSLQFGDNFGTYQEAFLKNGNSGAAARKEERATET